MSARDRAALDAAVIEAAEAWEARIGDDPRLWADTEDFALIAAVEARRAALVPPRTVIVGWSKEETPLSARDDHPHARSYMVWAEQRGDDVAHADLYSMFDELDRVRAARDIAQADADRLAPFAEHRLRGLRSTALMFNEHKPMLAEAEAAIAAHAVAVAARGRSSEQGEPTNG